MERNYKSKYLANGNITAAQYLTELIMERIAAKFKRVLPAKFWNHPDWNKDFRRQITAANKLLAEYDIRDILEALRHKDGKWITSLGAKKQIGELIKKNTHSSQPPEKTVVPIDNEWDFDVDEVFIPTVKRTSLWEKLQ